MSAPNAFPCLPLDLSGRTALVTGGGTGIGAVRGGSAYGAAKAGLQAFTRIVAAEQGPHGVRCNAMAVGMVASEGALPPGPGRA